MAAGGFGMMANSSSTSGIGTSSSSCATSKSLHSFQRQESANSFLSNLSVHSAPTCPSHGALGGPAAPPPSSAVQDQPLPPLPAAGPGKRTQGYVMPGQGQGNFESCSTQSSSSSASAPPDYATRVGPPMVGGGKHHHQPPPPPPHQNLCGGGGIGSSGGGASQQYPLQHRSKSKSRSRDGAGSHQQARGGGGAQQQQHHHHQHHPDLAKKGNDLYYVGEFYG